MHDTHAPQEDVNELAKLGYERRDFNVITIAKSIIYFFSFTTVCVVLAWGLIKIFYPDYGTPLPQIKVSRIPPPPQLQSNVTVKKDIRDLRAEEHRELTTYGWIDRKAGIVHIPVDRAIDLTLARGLPVSQGTTQEISQGVPVSEAKSRQEGTKR